jgi:hypothetical protein
MAYKMAWDHMVLHIGGVRCRTLSEPHCIASVFWFIMGICIFLFLFLGHSMTDLDTLDEQ